MKASNTGLVTVLAGQIPANYQTVAPAITSLANSPNTVLTFARITGTIDFIRQMAAVTFANMARQGAENARLVIPSLTQAQQLDEDQIQELRDIVAWRLTGNDATDEQAKQRSDTVICSQSTSLIERRVRMALGTGDRRGLGAWLARLPTEVKEKDEWHYRRAGLLLERGREAEAKEILHQLMQQHGFYPVVVAQRIDGEYELKVDKAPQNADSTLTQGPEMARAHKLMYWGLDNAARSEWANLAESKSRTEQAQLAWYAFNNRWWDLSVQATIAGKLQDHLEERFPLAYDDLFKRYTSGKEIPQNYAMAITRQESVWNPGVKSPVGTSGLTRITPGTATYAVKMFSIPGYSSPGQLLDPRTNINIGTSYLQYTYQQFDSNRTFSSAVYNAGPGRVRTWLGDSTGRIGTVAFIESIPFSEARGYVKNVLAYDAYYRYFMGDKPTLMNATEWGRCY